MKQMRNPQPQDNFKVAPIISDDKYQAFKTKTIGTVLGIATFGHFDYLSTEDQTKTIVLEIILYFVAPALIVIPSSAIVDVNLHALAVLIPVVFNTILAILADIIIGKNRKFHRYVATAVYSYVWAVHFWITRQLLLASIITGSLYAPILVLSLITVFTSCNTIIFAPVREFSASTFDYQQLNLHSTLYVRFYVAIPILLTQLAVYYSPEGTIGHPALPVLQFVAALLFVLWWFGWISSLYNNSMFIINNLFNCLVFGEQLTHSGHNFRGNSSWWASFNLFFSNVVAIGLNVILIRTMYGQNQLSQKIVQRQHVFLVFLASATSIITSIVMYFSYRCSNQKKSLIRLNKFDLTQKQQYQAQGTKRKVYKGRFFINHKQVLMFLANIFVPVAVSLLLVYVFAAYYDGYGNGKQMQKQTNFYNQKLTTYVILAVNVFCYLLFLLFKEITRVRSKIGCSINPCCFSEYYAQIQRDLYMKIILKFTGALAIMVLVLRIQSVTLFSNYIMRKTPLSPDPHPAIQFFIQSILLPILIYRSYKRSQTFSHFFHISIIVSLVLTLRQSTLYYYQSILVVLAFPNFPQNPFRLLFLSPFNIPDKLVHKNECLYRVGYILVNIVTLVLYIATLGTMQFTMIFGLPMYWCVIPTINCQMPKNSKSTASRLQKQSSSKLSDFQQTNQAFNLTNNINRSTPEHNLYQKIVSQIPFYIFRNKRPGYYLLRISKYILLVQVVTDFYGMFQIVNLIGLETQEVTTCHAKEGETIDRIVDYNWGANPYGIQCCACSDALKTVIHEEHRVKKVKITAENQIQLTGIIESSQFFQLFKKCLIRSIAYFYGKMLRKNGKNSLTTQQTKQAEVLLDDLQGRTTKDKIDQFFPHQFISEAGNKLGYNIRFKQLSPSKILIKKKLPPISKKQGKAKKQQIIDDFADLIGGASNTGNFLNNNVPEQSVAEKLNIDTMNDESVIKENTVSEDKKDVADLHSAVIVSAYLSIVGKLNYLQPERIYKIMKKDPSALSQFQFTGGLDLAANAVGCAFKIAIGKQLEAEDQISYEDYSFYDKNQYMGTLQSPGFSQAIQNHKQDIWTVAYNQTKKILSVKRLARNQTPLYMFSFQNHAVQAVWNNLRFQLLFATNDNDQRYSIQTHPYLLRNLLVEACEQPYGYAGYYSQEFLNL